MSRINRTSISESTIISLNYISFKSDWFGVQVSRTVIEFIKSPKVLPSEIKIMKNDAEALDLKSLVRNGTGLFDALIFMSNQQIATQFDIHQPKDMDESARSLFVKQNVQALAIIVMYLIFRGNYPAEDQPVPAFIRYMFPIEDDVYNYTSCLSSVRLSSFPKDWIKTVKVEEFPQEFLDRMRLGVAGYRLINCVRRNKPDSELNELDKDLRDRIYQNFCMIFDDYYWEVFPLTRSSEMTNHFPSFSKNLSQLLLFLYSQETLKTLVSRKVLYSLPKLDEGINHWRSWSDIKIKFKDLMFTRLPPIELSL